MGIGVEAFNFKVEKKISSNSIIGIRWSLGGIACFVSKRKHRDISRADGSNIETRFCSGLGFMISYKSVNQDVGMVSIFDGTSIKAGAVSLEYMFNDHERFTRGCHSAFILDYFVSVCLECRDARFEDMFSFGRRFKFGEKKFLTQTF